MHRLVVVDGENKVIGIITAGDIFKYAVVYPPVSIEGIIIGEFSSFVLCGVSRFSLGRDNLK